MPGHTHGVAVMYLENWCYPPLNGKRRRRRRNAYKPHGAPHPEKISKCLSQLTCIEKFFNVILGFIHSALVKRYVATKSINTGSQSGEHKRSPKHTVSNF